MILVPPIPDSGSSSGRAAATDRYPVGAGRAGGVEVGTAVAGFAQDSFRSVTWTPLSALAGPFTVGTSVGQGASLDVALITTKPDCFSLITVPVVLPAADAPTGAYRSGFWSGSAV
jgi:hypothetical protein